MSINVQTETAIVRDRRDELFGHPKGVYVCFFTEMWERFSFYGMKALLLLYLLQHHKFGDRVGYDMLGAYGGLVYTVPVIGGLLADRLLGMRKAVVFGGLLLVAGHLGMSVEGHAATTVHGVVQRDEAALDVFYVSLAAIIMGVGFLKPNISTIVGKLYPANDPRRDSGFSLFYAGINLGALFASIVCGYLGQTYGWSWGFGAAGIGMLLGLAQFLWGQRYLHGHAEPPVPERLRQPLFGLRREWWVYVLAVAGLLPVAGLMWAVANGAFTLSGEISLALLLMLLMMTAVLAWFVWFVVSQCTPVQRQQMIALLLSEIGRAPPLSLGLPLPRDRRLQALCGALFDDPADNRPLADWAARVGASERTLARLFADELKISFGAWRQQLRLARALDLIGRGRPSGEVAAELLTLGVFNLL